MTTPTVTAPAKPKKGRSPSYPNLSLDIAVERAASLYEAERRNPAPVHAVQGHWGFKPNTGPANLAVAALKKYGLLEDAGSGKNRTARLTDLGFDVVHHPEQATREQKIRQAALTPAIHQELWDKYGDNGLPSDATLRYELVTNRNFTETGAVEFIPQFRRTVTYANLTPTATVDPSGGEGQDEEPGGQIDDLVDTKGHREPRQQPPGGKSKVLTIPVPVIGGDPVVIAGTFPISEAAWTQFMAVLAAMKPGLVEVVEDAEDE